MTIQDPPLIPLEGAAIPDPAPSPFSGPIPDPEPIPLPATNTAAAAAAPFSFEDAGQDKPFEFPPEEGEAFSFDPNKQSPADHAFELIRSKSEDELADLGQRGLEELWGNLKAGFSPEDLKKISRASAKARAKGITAGAVGEALVNAPGSVAGLVKGVAKASWALTPVMGPERLKALSDAPDFATAMKIMFQGVAGAGGEVAAGAAAAGQNTVSLARDAARVALNHPLDVLAAPIAPVLKYNKAVVEKLTGVDLSAPKVKGDILNPTKILESSETDEAKQERFLNDVAVSEESQKAATGQSVILEALGIDAATAATHGIVYDPEVISGMATAADPTIWVPALAGLRAAKAGLAGYQVLNGAGKVAATAADRVGVELALQKLANIGAAGADKISALGAKALKYKLGRYGVVTGALTGHGLPAAGVVLGAYGVKHGAKAVAGIARLAASNTATDIGGAALRGTAGGLLFGGTLALGTDDPEKQADLIVNGGAIGAFGGLAHLGTSKVAGIAEAAIKARYDAVESGQNLKTLKPIQTTVLSTPGLENLEAMHQANLSSVTDPHQVNQVNILRLAMEAGAERPAFVLTDAQATALDPRMEKSSGVANIEVTGTDGQTKTIAIWKLDSAGNLDALKHEAGHVMFDAASPEDRAAFGSVFTEQQKSQMAAKNAGDPVQELAAEAIGHALRGDALQEGSTPVTAKASKAILRFMEKHGLVDHQVFANLPAGVERRPGVSSGQEAEQSVLGSDLAQKVFDNFMADPRVQAALKQAKPAAPAAPGAPVVPPVAPVAPVVPPGVDNAAAIAARLAELKKSGTHTFAQKLLDKFNRGEVLSPSDQANFDTFWGKLNLGKPVQPPIAPVAPVVPVKPPVVPVKPPVVPVKPPVVPVKPPVVPVEPPVVPVEPPVKPVTDLGRREPVSPELQQAVGLRADAQQRVNSAADAVAKDATLTPAQKADQTRMLTEPGAKKFTYDAAKDTGAKAAESEVLRRIEVEKASKDDALRAPYKQWGDVVKDVKTDKAGNTIVETFSGENALVNLSRVLNQARKLGEAAKAHIPYTNWGDGTEIARDLVNYTKNQAAGFKGDGTAIERPANSDAFIPPTDPKYAPVLIDPKKAQFLNTLMGWKVPETARAPQVGARNPITINAEDIVRAQKVPTAGRGTGVFFEKPESIKGREIKDFNQWRVDAEKLGFNFKDLASTDRRLALRRISKVENLPGFELGTPAADVVAAGFMPEKRAIQIEGPDGKKYDATFDGWQDFSALGKGMVPQITTLEPVPGFASGTTTYKTSLEAKGYKVQDFGKPQTLKEDPAAHVPGEVSKRPDDTALKLPTAGVDPAVKLVGEDIGVTPARFMAEKSLPGAEHTEQSQSYPDAIEKAKARGGNAWVRQSDSPTNADRTLLVQFAPELMYPNGPDPISTPYYEKLYSGVRKGFSKAATFWEVPQWAAVAKNNLAKSDFYAVHNVAEAKAFLEKADYGNVAFSVMDVSKALTEELVPHIKGEVHLGGYTDRTAAAALSPKARIWNSMNEYIESQGVKYQKGFDYAHFRGTPIIPRMELSAGCRHKCTFCTIDRKVTNSPVSEINAQVDSFADLNAKLVYLNDKTFGQSPNVAEMPRLFKQMKEANPEFEGFVIQTTAAQMKLFKPEFLKDAGIKYVELGVESYNDSILKPLRKPANEKLIDEAVTKLRETGVNFIPNIVIGFPEETAATYAHTMEFLRKNEDIISHVNVYNLAVYEGTELSGKIKTKTAGDVDENTAAKSFHKDPALHAKFAQEVYDFATERLSKPAAFMAEKGQTMTEAGREIERKGLFFTGTRDPQDGNTVLQYVNSSGEPVADISFNLKDGAKSASVNMVFTDETYRGLGIAEALTREMGARLQEAGVTDLKGTAVSNSKGEFPAIGLRKKVFGNVEIRPIKGMQDDPLAIGMKDIRSKVSPTQQFMAEKTWVTKDGKIEDAKGDHARNASARHGVKITNDTRDKAVNAALSKGEVQAELMDNTLYLFADAATFTELNKKQRAAIEDAAIAGGHAVVYNGKHIEDFGPTADANYMAEKKAGDQPTIKPKGYHASEFWFGPDGVLHSKYGHEQAAVEHLKKVAPELGIKHSGVLDEDMAAHRYATYDEMATRGWLRAVKDGNKLYIDAAPGVEKFSDMPATARKSAERLAESLGLEIEFDGAAVGRVEGPGLIARARALPGPEGEPQFMPDKEKTGWLLPDGKFKGLTQLHELDLAANYKDYNKRFGTKLSGDPVEAERLVALRDGFVRFRTSLNGDMTVEVNQKFWDRNKKAILARALSAQKDLNTFNISVLTDRGREVFGTSADVWKSADPEQSIRDAMGEVKLPGGEITAKEPTLIQRARAMRDPEAPSFMPSKIGDFRKEETLPEAIKGEGWAILTATQEDIGAHSHPDNISANKALRDYLDKAGYKYEQVDGTYEGIDQGANYLVEGITPADAHAIGNRFSQKSVVIPEGLYYADGTLNPIDPSQTVIGAGAEKLPYWSRLKKGTPFSIGFDFSKKEPFVPGGKDLFGHVIEPQLPTTGQDKFSRKEFNTLSHAQERAKYPEALFPRPVNGEPALVGSDLVNSPMVRKLGREKAVDEAAKILVKKYRENRWRPEQKAGEKWYSEFEPTLKEFFGEDSGLFAELLAATSPQNSPAPNFKSAWEAYKLFKKGWYDDLISTYRKGLDMSRDGTLKTAYEAAVPEAERPSGPSDATYINWWVDTNRLKPTKSPRVGKAKIADAVLFSHSSDAVLAVVTRTWLNENRGLKTNQFVRNLLALDHGATIDLWADRTVREAVYKGYQARWRIQPENSTGVKDADFHFAQEVFKKAATKLGILPDALQGALWFTEKALWGENGWSKLEFGSYKPSLDALKALGTREQHLAEVPASRSLALEQVKIQQKQKMDAQNILIKRKADIAADEARQTGFQLDIRPRTR